MQNVIDTIYELDKLKGVTRKVRPIGLDRYENSAEHSWQLAMLAASLYPHAGVKLDMARVIGMLLVHDVGEIDTGDTMFFHDEGIAERKAAERAAIQRIFGRLNSDAGQGFIALWEEFEACESAEARFAHAADRAMPVLLNLANQGQSWRENSIPYSRVVERVRPPIEQGCPALWTWLEPQLEAARVQGWFGSAE